MSTDEQWLREWATGEAEYPPKDLRDQVGRLLDVADISRQIYDQLKNGRWDEIGVDIDLVDKLCAVLAAAQMSEG